MAQVHFLSSSDYSDKYDLQFSSPEDGSDDDKAISVDNEGGSLCVLTGQSLCAQIHKHNTHTRHPHHKKFNLHLLALKELFTS